MHRPATLNGRFFLVVEDEYLTASSMVMTLEDAGAEVAGPVSTIDGALALVLQRGSELDGAILDINLRGSMAYPVAEKLIEQQIPFVFVTGYECRSLPVRFRDRPCLNKPCDEQQLVAMLGGLPARYGLQGA